jgi:hypothetical protein
VKVFNLLFVLASLVPVESVPELKGGTWTRQINGSACTVEGYSFFDNTTKFSLPDGADAIKTWPNNDTAQTLIRSGTIPPPLSGYTRGNPTLINVDPSHGAPVSASIAWRFVDTKTP